VVGLPPDWLRFYDLEVGDAVEIVYNNIILIKPPGMPLDLEALRKEMDVLQALMDRESVRKDQI
jgi:antitoxin component of RelBE/YafQ-DinJ toxin-antitoxin module